MFFEGHLLNDKVQQLWDERYSNKSASDEKKLQLRIQIGKLAQTFSATAVRVGTKIISEISLPDHQVHEFQSLCDKIT